MEQPSFICGHLFRILLMKSLLLHPLEIAVDMGGDLQESMQQVPHFASGSTCSVSPLSIGNTAMPTGSTDESAGKLEND